MLQKKDLPSLSESIASANGGTTMGLIHFQNNVLKEELRSNTQAGFRTRNTMGFDHFRHNSTIPSTSQRQRSDMEYL